MAYGREVVIDEGDAEIQADAMKLVTVFMNLIGNALKYSDGTVRVVWRAAGPMLVIGVCDRGTAGRGLTRAQAERLFTAFGRLPSHAQIEGTGLGLLSVRKIVEAHGGEAFIMGFDDGTSDSPGFSTAANGPYPMLLDDGFRTAFVVTCPLAAPDAGGGETTETARDATLALR